MTDLQPFITWPNVITILRAGLIPPLCSSLWSRDLGTFFALVAVFFALDLADGLVARKLGQATTFGRNLDIGVDSLAALCVSIVLFSRGQVPAWFAVPLLTNFAVYIALFVRAARANGWVFVPAKRKNLHAVLGFAWIVFAVIGIYNPLVNTIIVVYLACLVYLTWEYWAQVARASPRQPT